MTTLHPRLPGDPRSVAGYLIAVLAIGIPLLSVAAVTRRPLEPFILVLVYGMLGGAILIVRRPAGSRGVRALFAGALRWRVGWRAWALAIGALPVATVAVALATGTAATPPDPWVTVGSYLFATLIFGTLLVNLWEETVWTGYVQRHLTTRFGLRRAAVTTALPFAALHVPLGFAGDATARERSVNVALIVLLAPALRYILGRLDRSSRGSLLAVGVMHASFNASGAMDVLEGGWQHIAGLAITAVVLLLLDRRHHADDRQRADAVPVTLSD